jgi:hypothetical protein
MTEGVKPLAASFESEGWAQYAVALCQVLSAAPSADTKSFAEP